MAHRPLSKRTRERIVDMLVTGTPRATIAKTLGISREAVYAEISRLEETSRTQAIAPVVTMIDAAEQLSFVVIRARGTIRHLEDKAAAEADLARTADLGQLVESLRSLVGEWAQMVALLRSSKEDREFLEEALGMVDREAPEAAAEIRRRIEEIRNTHVDMP